MQDFLPLIFLRPPPPANTHTSRQLLPPGQMRGAVLDMVRGCRSRLEDQS